MFHHFVRGNMNRSERVQVHVLHRIMDSSLPNSERENSIEWELKHSSSCVQVGRILAEKRGLEVEIVEMIAVLHDIYVIDTGKYTDHAKHGAPIARNVLGELADFTAAELDTITEAIANHSNKHIYTNNKYIEIAKDLDTLDCFLYDKDIYHEKPPHIRKEYFRRIIRIRNELGLPENEFFTNELKRLENEKPK